MQGPSLDAPEVVDSAMGSPAAGNGIRRGPYRVLRRLGKGGMGTVDLGLLEAPFGGITQLVAIKSPHRSVASDPVLAAAFVDEMRLTAQLNHSSAIRLYCLGQDEAGPYAVLEYVRGLTLAQILRVLNLRGTRFPAEIAGRVVADVLAALDHLHTLRGNGGACLGVVHRDVSPSNVMLAWDGTVRLIDLGVARSSLNSVHTAAGVLKGHWAYVAPEAVLQHDVDRRADTWGAGVLLWEMLVGRSLFRRKTPIATLHAVVGDPIPDPCEVEPRVDERIARVCMRALSRDPARRYSNAAHMAADLRQAGAASQPRAVEQYLAWAFRAEAASQRAADEEALRRSRPPTTSDVRALRPGPDSAVSSDRDLELPPAEARESEVPPPCTVLSPALPVDSSCCWWWMPATVFAACLFIGVAGSRSSTAPLAQIQESLLSKARESSPAKTSAEVVAAEPVRRAPEEPLHTSPHVDPSVSPPAEPDDAPEVASTTDVAREEELSAAERFRAARSAARVHFAAGRFESAATAYRSALRLRRRDVRMWLGLGAAHEALGNTSEALRAYRQARDLRPSDERIRRRYESAAGR